EISSDFENEFPDIEYNNALTSEPEVSSEPTEPFENDFGRLFII
ncbi:hypothetical protein Tco_0963760, partial [Tanacetum coccineum]